MFVQIVSSQGRSVLAELGEDLDALHDEMGSRLEIRRRWMQEWADAFPRWEPWVVGVRRDGQLRAVAPLARRTAGGCVQVVSLCHSDQDVSPVVCASPADAALLVETIRSELDRTGRPWRMHLRQLDAGSPVIDAADELLSVRQCGPGMARPELVLDGGDDTGVSRNMRSSAARHRNRLARSGLDVDERWVTDPTAIRRSIEDVLSVHRARDLDLRARSALADPGERTYYLGVVDAHVERFELFELRLDGELAGYSLCVRDRDRLFVFDNRMSPKFSRFAPGLLANLETVHRAVSEPGLSVLDWGSGEQRYKLSASNRVVPSVDLVAWSSPLFRRAARARRDAMSRADSLRRLVTADPTPVRH